MHNEGRYVYVSTMSSHTHKQNRVKTLSAFHFGDYRSTMGALTAMSIVQSIATSQLRPHHHP